MRQNGTVLIVDDKKEDGEPISAALQEKCIPHLFFWADDDNIMRKQNEESFPIGKVQTVFQDINLTGGSSPATTDYEQATLIIEMLLPPDNGPWLMVAWSTWADSDTQTDHPKELFRHLRNNLPPNIRPYSYIVMDKTRFTRGGKGDHDEVRAYSDMDDEMKADLDELVKEKSQQMGAMKILFEWERAIVKAVSETISELDFLTYQEEDYDKRLGKALYELSRAEEGKQLKNGNALKALYRILNSQLLDRFSETTGVTLDLLEYEAEKGWPDMKKWKRKINKFLHFDNGAESSGPGTLYTYKSYLSSIAECHSLVPSSEDTQVAPMDEVVGEGVLKQTLNKAIESSNEPDLFARAKLAECIVVEVTPPCDHAQDKAEWRKFCAGFILDITGLSNGKRGKLYSDLKKCDYIWNSCEFLDTDERKEELEKVILFNSKLIFSVRSHELPAAILSKASPGKIKEQMCRALTHWLGSQLTRPGYTQL